MPRPQDLPCADCGRLMVRYPDSLPAGQARCQPCRDIERPPVPRVPCSHCGATIKSRLPPGKARCLQCRKGVNRKRPDVHCSDCGKWIRYADSPSDAKASRCHPCRRIRPTVPTEHTCVQCGQRFHRKQPQLCCSRECAAKRQTVRADCDWGVQRGKREASAPGLTKNGRDKLRTKWKQQQKPCAYCGAPADTIDHVMPLVRGGTNYEGNLLPACRRCNSSKSGKTIIEWRHGVSLGKVREAPDWMGKPKVHRVRKAAEKIKPPRRLVPCAICQEQTIRTKYCSDKCCAEGLRRITRDRYRAKHGIAYDFTQPTSKWAA